MQRFVLGILSLFTFAAHPATAHAADPLVVYTARKEELIKPLFELFTRETGIPVTFLNDESPKLLARLKSEGDASPADVLLTADVANLTAAKEAGLFKKLDSGILNKNVPAAFRDPENEWFGLSRRVRAIFYNKDLVKPSELSTYEALADSKWKGQILARSSSHSYNQSLISNIIAVHGQKNAQAWANGFTANLARTPQGGDADQLKAIAAGEAKLAIANSYYYARMFASGLPEDRLVKEKVGIFWPNQKAGKGDLDGAHVNISGGGVLKTSKQSEQAQKFLEFLTQEHAQLLYVGTNKEFPINPSVKPDAVLVGFGPFKADSTPLTVWAKFSKDAIRTADTAGWK